MIARSSRSQNILQRAVLYSSTCSRSLYALQKTSPPQLKIRRTRMSTRFFSFQTHDHSSSSSDGIVSIALNNPQKRNALSTQVLESLYQQLIIAKQQPETKVVIIKGLEDDDDNTHNSSNGVFCSGHDLKELTKEQNENDINYQQRMKKLFKLCSKVMIELSTYPVPTIVQVDGIATAAGCQLVTSCDLAVATETSRFATPGVHIGLFCSTPAVPLIRTISKKHAMEMLLTGNMISAQRAYEIGLVNRIVSLPTTPTDNDINNNEQQQEKQLSKLLNQEVQNLATSIANKSNSCIQTGLHTLRAQQSVSSLDDAYKIAEQTMVDNLIADDAKEGIAAFLQKRKPNWKK